MLPLAAPASVSVVEPLRQRLNVAGLSVPATGALTVTVGAGVSVLLAALPSPVAVAVMANE